MLALNDEVKVFVATEPVDMRKSIDGLSVFVVDILELPPRTHHIYVFRNKSRTKVKVLLWDRNGFALYYKRLEKGKFRFPEDVAGDTYEIHRDQLSWLLAGLDFHLMTLFPELNYENYF